MSTRTPTKQKSASKKTPVKSTTKKQQVSSAIKSNVKSVQAQSAKKNVNMINDIKDKFYQSKTQSLSSNDLYSQLKQILSSKGIENATTELTALIQQSNLKVVDIASSLTKLNSENVNGLLYLIQQIINQESNQTPSLNLSVWIAAISSIQPDLIFYNDKLKAFVNSFSVKSVKQYQHLPIIRGKIALLAGF